MSTRCTAWIVVSLALLLGCSQQVEPRTGPLAPIKALLERATPLPFERIGAAADQPAIDFPESSGLTYHPLRKTLFTVSDDGHVGEYRTDGTLVQRRHLLFEDFEGITCHSQTGLLYIAIEGRDNVLEVDPDGLVIRREYDLDRVFKGRKLYQLGGDGIEGIAFVPDPAHPEGGTFFVLNRSSHPKDLDDPPLVLEFELPVSSTSNDELEAPILSYTLLQVTDLSGLHYHAPTNRFYAVSDDNKLLLELSRTGEILNVHELPAEDPEGIAMDDAGILYIAQDSEGIVKFRPTGVPRS